MDIVHHYTEKGSGDVLLLLHGNGEDGTYFKNQIEYFSKEFHVIAVDTRGHGKTPRGDKPFTIRQFAEDLRVFMDRLVIEKANILGFSDGGNIAMIFAMKYPERVNRLIINGGNLCGNGVKASVQIPIILGYKIASLFSKRSPEALKNAELLGLMVNDPNIAPDELAQIKADTLVIAGKRDMIKEKHTKLIYSNIPGAKLKIIDGNHFIASNNPDDFNLAADGFLHGE